MTTFLYSLLPLTAGGDRMAQIDPHGWTLTLISVGVVFAALIVLYFIYNISGNIFSGKYKRKPKAPKKGLIDGETAAAIALALQAASGSETEAAIATALHLYLSDAVHDVEPGFITIRHIASSWDDRQSNFRKTPRK